jgi:hypothetical protein
MPAIKVGPGRHTLSYTYSPVSVHIGGLLSVIGLLTALVWLIVGRRLKIGKPDWMKPDEAKKLEVAPAEVVNAPDV